MVNGQTHPILGAQGQLNPCQWEIVPWLTQCSSEKQIFPQSRTQAKGELHLKGAPEGQEGNPRLATVGATDPESSSLGKPTRFPPGAKAFEEDQECSSVTGGAGSNPSLGDRQTREVHTQCYCELPRD